MRIERYNPSRKELWDQFVRESKNGTFLFLRDYMDYHSDRFQDFSLIAYDDDGEPIALFPANRKEHACYSHSGLTYGGFVTNWKMKLPTMIELMEKVVTYLREEHLRELHYVTIPHIYARVPADEDRYALFVCQAQCTRSSALAVVRKGDSVPWQERRKRGAKKARQAGLAVRASEDWETYWEILCRRLQEAHGEVPVHSLSEIQMLHSRFPKNIHLYAAFRDPEMLAGIVIYETALVARTQYIAASREGRQIGAIDLIVHELLASIYKDKAYIDFGSSEKENGRGVDVGLVDQKEGYGARMVVHNRYFVNLDTLDLEALTRALQ